MSSSDSHGRLRICVPVGVRSVPLCRRLMNIVRTMPEYTGTFVLPVITFNDEFAADSLIERLGINGI